MKNTIILLFGVCVMASANGQDKSHVTGPYKASEKSLEQYRYPDWFRDAKFGIWSHWGPQAVPREGDWYAKNMYIQGSRQNVAHVKKYGPPSKFGYKDIIPLWKAEKWRPEELMKLYKKAGARYFVSMGTHHDNFFLWHSSINKWNAVNMGPHKDVVKLWQQAAKKEGLRFGVSEHLAASFNWFQPSHGADATGPLAGVPYDGADPAYQDLYHEKADSADINNWLTNNPKWHAHWLKCIEELIDNYHPDLLYSDSQVPFGETGLEMVAHFYNDNVSRNNGRMTAVYTPKQPSGGRWVQDVERGLLDSICPFPWQTDTSIGDWYYQTGQSYKTAEEIIRLLLDIVSKNGNLLLNVVQTPEGDLEPDVISILDGLGAWMQANSEGIYGSRPWKIYGEGPSTIKGNQAKGHFGGISDVQQYQTSDVRFTTKGNSIYAYCMKTPEKTVSINSLAKGNAYTDKSVKAVYMLGVKKPVRWQQEADALVITLPDNVPASGITGFRVEMK